MKSFLFTLGLKTKLDIRSSEIFITYYGVPLVFFFVMGAVFTSTMPEAKETLIATMTIFYCDNGGRLSALLQGLSSTLERISEKPFDPLAFPCKQFSRQQ